MSADLLPDLQLARAESARRRSASFWIRWGAPLLGVMSSLALILASLRAQGTIARASEVVIRGEVERCTDAVHRALRGHPAPATDAYLQEALAAAQPLGLRYAAVVGALGEIMASAGTPAQVPGWPAIAANLPPGTILSAGSRARLYSRPLQPPRPSSGPDGIQPPPRHLPPTHHLVVEVEPAVALALQAESRRTLGLGVLAALGLMATGAALLLLQRRHEALQERLARDQRLAELGQMSAVVAHELRNPLASLKGHAELLQEALASPAPPLAPLRSKAARVLHEAERLSRLTRDLLEFVRSGVIQRREEDPLAPLQRAAQALDPARVLIQVGALPPTFPMDGDRVEQVLVNLLRNALDASPPDRAIEAAVDLEAASGDGGGAALRYSVRDHGPGVPAGQEERIFEPFYTLRVHGTGLGLAVVRRIVALHGGRIAVERPAGGGACFRVWLPAERVIK